MGVRIKKNLLWTLLLVGSIALTSCRHYPDSSEKNRPIEESQVDSSWINDAIETKDLWKLDEHLDDESITILGYQTRDDFPYGYNVGRIEDEEVGSAILITPGTSITIEDSFENLFSLSFEYMLHPWAAANSDGAMLNISIESNGNNDSYTFKAGDFAQNESILLDQYADEKVRIVFSVQNEQGKGVECDWLVIKNVVINKSAEYKTFGGNGYVRSATYFGDEWPVNFWNSELDNLEQDMEQIRADGFDSIILVIPWREFQTELDPIAYNGYAFDSLNRIMRAAEQAGLSVYTRVGYTWDYYHDNETYVVDRFERLLGEESVRDAWYFYMGKLYEVLSEYPCFCGAFLTWEDFWNILSICDEKSEEIRREKAAYNGYQEWVESNYTLSEYNSAFGSNYESYATVPVPYRTEPAMAAMYSFYDDFLMTLLGNSQKYFPDLSMEVRMDWDVVYTVDGNMDYYKHTKTFACGGASYTATMYGIPMGFENVGERVGYQEAVEKTEYILSQLKLQNNNKPVYIEQFIFADNTPGFEHNAQIREEELNLYLENVAPILLENAEGYGIWTYRNYCANMIYNSQFALGQAGWETQGEVAFGYNKGSMTCFLGQGATLSQSVNKQRSHANADEYFVSFDVVSVDQEGELSVSLGGNMQIVSVEKCDRVCLRFSRPQTFDITINSKNCIAGIDNIKLYSQVQQGFLYDDDNNELLCIDGIRQLNKLLSQ